MDDDQQPSARDPVAHRGHGIGQHYPFTLANLREAAVDLLDEEDDE